MGLFAKQDVQDGFGAGKLFAEVHAYAPVSGDSVFGVEGNGVNAKVLADVESPLVVEFLGDDGEGVLAKDLLGADHGVKGAETGVVQENAVCRYAFGDKVLLHILRLVVGAVAVVSADQHNLDLACLVEVYNGLDAVNIVDVRSSSTADRVGAKKQANVVAGNVVDIVEQLSSGAFFNDVTAPDNNRDAD